MTENDKNKLGQQTFDQQIEQAKKAAWQQRPGPRPWVVASLIGINLAIYIIMGSLSDSFGELEGKVLKAWGARDGAAVIQGAWWRLFAAMFLHANLLHLLVNLYSLYVLGRYLEPQLGSPRFLALYLLAGLAGNILSQLTMDPAAMSIGASGAIFGLAGGLLAFQALASGGIGQLFKRQHGLNLLMIIMLNLMLGLSIPGIDNSAHIGGLMCGICFGHWFFAGCLVRSPALSKDQQRIIERKRRLVLIVTVSMLVIGAIRVMLGGSLDRLKLVTSYLVAGQYPAALVILEEHRDQLDDNPFALYQLGELSIELGKYRQAEEALARCLEVLAQADDPKKDSLEGQVKRLAPYRLALVQILLGERDSAERVLAEAGPRGIAERRLASQLWQMLGRGDQAAAVLRDDFEDYRARDLRIYEALLELYLTPHTHNREQAILVSLEVQQTFPKMPRAVFLEGRVHEAFTEYREAREIYLTEEGRLVSDWEWWYHVGLCSLRLGDMEEAVISLLNARHRILSSSDSADLEAQGARFDIETHVNQALRLSGRIVEADQKRSLYLKVLRENASLNPTLNNLNQLAYFLALTVVPEEAEESFAASARRRASGLSPDDQTLLDEALTAARASVAQFAGGENLDTLAWVLYRRGEYEEAREVQQQALEKTIVRTPELVFHLAAIHHALGEKEQADRLYRELLDLSLDFDGQEELFPRIRALR